MHQMLTQLKLARIREIHQEWFDRAAETQMPYPDFLRGLLQEELLAREENQLRRRLKDAGPSRSRGRCRGSCAAARRSPSRRPAPRSAAPHRGCGPQCRGAPGPRRPGRGATGPAPPSRHLQQRGHRARTWWAPVGITTPNSRRSPRRLLMRAPCGRPASWTAPGSRRGTGSWSPTSRRRRRRFGPRSVRTAR